MASPTKGVTTVTVAHVTNSLAQIESWVGAIRTALGGLPPATPLPMGAAAPDPFASAIQVQKNCPPPPHKPRPVGKKKSAKKKSAKKKK